MREGWYDLAKMPGEKGREDLQAGWHAWAGEFLWEAGVLDVGAGLGRSRGRLRTGSVTLQDVGPGLPVDIRADVSLIDAKSYDAVTAFDVIEHVEDDETFLAHLVRIARKWVILTTPNFDVSHCRNPAHVREYSPYQWVELVSRYFPTLYLAGTASGGVVVPTWITRTFMQHGMPHQGVVLDVGERQF
jgi:hypothetical protein